MPTRAWPRPCTTSSPACRDVVVHRVEAGSDRLLLEQHRPRREHPVVEVRGPGLPVALEARDLGHRQADVDGRVPVGDVGVQLQPDPRTAAPRDLVAVAAEVEHLLHRRPGPAPASPGRPASTRSTTAPSTTCTRGRRRLRRRRRRSAGRPTGWRGAARRPSGRARAPCRTRARPRRRRCTSARAARVWRAPDAASRRGPR